LHAHVPSDGLLSTVVALTSAYCHTLRPAAMVAADVLLMAEDVCDSLLETIGPDPVHSSSQRIVKDLLSIFKQLAKRNRTVSIHLHASGFDTGGKIL